MTVLYNKIRLGAPDVMTLDSYGTGAIDLGASVGGAVFGYNATYLPIEIDQSIMPVNAYKTKEEIMFSVALAQSSSSVVMAAMSMAPASSLTTVVAAAAVTPAVGPTVATAGTAGVATVSYTLVGVTGNGDTIPSPVGSIATANAVQTAANYNVVTLPVALRGVVGVLAYKVIRTVGGASQGFIGSIPSVGTQGTAFFLNDTGQVATPYVASVANPTIPNMDQIAFGNQLSVPFHTFDWAVPKNDGTILHWRGHLNRVFSAKQVSLDYKRDKLTEVNKVELLALADTTMPVGSQAGWVAEEY